MFLEQRREFYSNRIKAGKRIGPHNIDILSIGSYLEIMQIEDVKVVQDFVIDKVLYIKIIYFEYMTGIILEHIAKTTLVM